jgi:hypothetical protein
MIRYGCYHGYGGEKPGPDRVTDIAHQVVVLMRRRYPADPDKKGRPICLAGREEGELRQRSLRRPRRGLLPDANKRGAGLDFLET